MTTTSAEKKFSIFSILSLISAILSFQFGAILGMIFAVLAILFGLGGVALALLPHVRGGLVSTSALVLGVIGVIAAIVKIFI